ncbi:MAG: hypothetical protein ACLFPE_14975 [Bacteroidales bacterium]
MESMYWYQWFSLAALLVCLGTLLLYLIRLIRLGKPTDYSKPLNSPAKAMPYAFIGAMSPRKKESAYLHLPTYTAGIVYHLGTFLSVTLFILILFRVSTAEWMNWSFAGFLIISGFSGFGILIKRMSKKNMRLLSNPDDYASNLLVTIFQLLTAATLINPLLQPAYFVFSGILLLYIPLGKLRHMVYFFAARYHLGFFFGWRGVWPPKQS